jgi:hypothetical protein
MPKAKAQSRLGTYVSRTTAGETYKAYVPSPLPPSPPLDMDRLYKPLDQAMKALGELDALARLLPDMSLFLYMYVRKEALVSSQIEGTQSLRMMKAPACRWMTLKKFQTISLRSIMGCCA